MEELPRWFTCWDIIFLSNRLNKALIGLAEMDKAITNLVTKEQTAIDRESSDDTPKTYEMFNDNKDEASKIMLKPW